MGDSVLGEVTRVLDRHGLAGRLDGDESAARVPCGEREILTSANAILEGIERHLAAAGDSPARSRCQLVSRLHHATGTR